MSQTIGIIGTGQVGSSLGVRLASLDYKILYGSREPSSPKILELLEQSSGHAQALSIDEAIIEANIIILALPWKSVEGVIKSVKNWTGKVIIDCTNPLKDDLTGLDLDLSDSAAEQIAQWAEGAHVVKAFNTVGSLVMNNPQFGMDRAALFVCGDDKNSKGLVEQIGSELGFDVTDTGDLTKARYLEQMAVFWIHMAFNQGLGSDFALKILRR